MQNQTRAIEAGSGELGDFKDTRGDLECEKSVGARIFEGEKRSLIV